MFAHQPWVWSSLLSTITLGTASTVHGAYLEFNSVLSGPSQENTAIYGQAHSNVIPRNTPNTDSQASSSVQIALASYIHPSGENLKAWDRILGPDSGKITTLVANVASGPGPAFDAEWARVIEEAKSKSKKVLGYVYTGWLGLRERPKEYKLAMTRPEPTDISDWVAQIQSDVDTWYSTYGKDRIDGIFFDEAYNECFHNGIDTAEIYRFISENIKRKYPGSMTVLNPGAAVKKCFEHSADTIITFEGGFEDYYNDRYTKIDWMPKDPRKLWHIVKEVPRAHAAETASKARSNRVGFIQITDATGDNPYSKLPDEAYMREVMRAVDGGSPTASPPPAFPETRASTSIPNLKIAPKSDTSLNFAWDYKGEPPYAIIIESDAHEVARIPGNFSRTTISGLNLKEQQMAFSARALFQDGSMSDPSKSITVGQKAQTVSSTSIQSSTFLTTATTSSTASVTQSISTTLSSQASLTTLSSSQTSSTTVSTSHTASGTKTAAPAKSTSSASTRNLPVMSSSDLAKQLMVSLFGVLTTALLFS